MKPKKRLKEIYDEYLEKSKTYFMNLKEDNILLLTQKCGFSTISECRKAINELEKQETWQDILDEFAKFGKGKLGDWLIENFKVPTRL